MTAQEIMDELFRQIEHGDTKHRNWLKGKLDAFALDLVSELQQTYEKGWDAACKYWNPEYR